VLVEFKWLWDYRPQFRYRVGFADLANYLPPTRTPGCAFEYRTLVRAFEKEITPHIDQEIARRVLDTDWLQRLESEPAPQK
jgi:hypothetical protein